MSPELQALAKRIPFQFVSHMSGEKEHVLEYLNEPLNVAAVIVTKYFHGQPRSSTRTFGLNQAKAKGYPNMVQLLNDHPHIAANAAELYPPK